MNKKIRVTAVSYLNTKPLLYGLFKSPVAAELDLQLDIPSVCAEKLRSGQADLGLVPVAIIPELGTPYIVSDYCIGAEGMVKTVCVYAKKPLEELEYIYLDYHSRTSVELARILIREYWKVDVQLLPAQPGFETKIQGTTGALLIGDRTMGLESKYPFVYDLGEAWLKHTGLPFVFAAWVSTRPLDPTFIQRFNTALKTGLDFIPELIYLLPAQPDFDLKTYFTKYISYPLTPEKKEALALFLRKMNPADQTIIRFPLEEQRTSRLAL
ncbi:MAG TPA: menaquinone biosynthesis protein [Haliscomenobacter sp.]|nr:menaquinone biosynthesis protein [Haliscomenobacter sp.]